MMQDTSTQLELIEYNRDVVLAGRYNVTVVPRGLVVTKDLIERAQRWNVTLTVEDELDVKDKTDQYEVDVHSLHEVQTMEAKRRNSAEHSDEPLESDTRSLHEVQTPEALRRRMMHDSATPEPAATAPQKAGSEATEFAKAISGNEVATSLTAGDILMSTAKARYEEYTKDIHYIYTHYSTHKAIDGDALRELAGSIVSFVSANSKYILKVASLSHNRIKNFLVIHSIRTAIYCTVIASRMGLKSAAIRELAVAAIIHEIGMLRLPPQLYIVNRRLLPQERASMTAHTVYGYNIAKAAGLGTPIQIAILEHHEKCNSQGYPRALGAAVITIQAKILAVACTLEAMTAPRSYHEEVTIPKALDLLRKECGAQYDEAVLRACEGFGSLGFGEHEDLTSSSRAGGSGDGAVASEGEYIDVAEFM